MYKVFRMIFAVIAAALAVACVVLGIYFGLSAALLCAAGTLLFFVGSMFFKYLQECKEERSAGSGDGQDRPGGDK